MLPEHGVVIEQWTTAEGLPLDHVNDLELGDDGRLWLATFEGLWTWDGATILPAPADIADEIGSVRLHTIRRHPADGAMWVITEDHVAVRIAQGHARRLDLGDRDPPVRAFGLIPHGGTLWLRTDRGLYTLTDPPQPILPDLVDEPVVGLAWSEDGSMWVAHRTSVLRVHPGGRVIRYDQGDGLPPRIFTLHGLREGGPWVFAQGGRLDEGYVFDGARFVPSPGRMSGPLACAAERTAGPTPCPPVDAAAGRWRVHEHGVLFDGAEVLATKLPIQMSLQDPSGGLWLATEGEGLYRLTQSRVAWTAPPPEDTRVTRLWQEASGRLWAYTPGVHWWTRTPARLGFLEIHEEGHTPHRFVEYLFEGPDGATWGVGLGDRPVRLGALSADSPTPAQSAPSGYLAQARAAVRVDDAVFVAMGAGVARGDAAGWRQVAGDSLQSCFALALPAPDRIVAAEYGTGLRAITGGRLEDGAAGGPLTHVRHLRVAPSGLWASTEDQGLCVIPDPTGPVATWEVRCLGRDLLPAKGAHMSLPDGRGRVWVSTNRGLVAFDERALDAFARGASAPHGLVLAARQGLPNPEANGGNDRVMILDESGVLSVATQDGVVHVDTSTFAMPSRPTVHVVATDPQTGATTTALSLDPAHPAVHLSWWAPDLDWGDQIVFRTRLRGGAWSEPSRRRQLTLAEVPAGEGAFEVQAGLASQWGPVASLSIRRRYRPTEHPLMPVAVLLASALGMALIAWYRQRLLARRARALEAEVAAQTRTLVAQRGTVARQRDEIARQRDEIAGQRDEIEAQARRLADIDELKSRMIVNLHHELRTPLSLVLGPLRDASTQGRHPELALALRNAERLERLVAQLAQIAHMEAGTTRLSTSRIDLGEFSRRCAERYLPMARDKDIQLDVVTELGDLSVFADAELLEDALGNLVHNALKFTPTGGRVQVSVNAEPDGVRVEVRDTGIGVPEAHRGRIFDRLYQVERQDDRAYDGSGLGLALAREVVELHGGEVGHRPNPDGGSIFWFRIPSGTGHLAPDDIDVTRTPPGAGAAPPVPIPADADATDLPLVLVVEDHPDMRAYLASTLSEGHRVITAANGEEGLATARRHRPAVVVSDVMMPGMDGVRMTRALRDDPDLARTPVVLVTAKTRVEDRVEGLQIADAWLSKPFHAPELRAHVHRLSRRAALPAEATGSRDATPPNDGDLGATDRALLDRLHAALHARLADQDLRVADLARQVGMSERTLQRELSRICGTSPSTWMREQRLAAARDLLRRGAVTTSGEAAAAVGMSRAYFSRAYKAWAGHPPSEDRR